MAETIYSTKPNVDIVIKQIKEEMKGEKYMDIIKSYKDLCKEIKIWELRVETYEAEIRAIKRLARLYGPSDVKGIDYTKPRVQESNQIGFEEALFRLHQLEEHISMHQSTIDEMEELKKEMEERIGRLDGLDKKVVYMREIQGKSLKEIADELGYSEIYIKKISARNPKKYT